MTYFQLETHIFITLNYFRPLCHSALPCCTLKAKITFPFSHYIQTTTLIFTACIVLYTAL